ncbi:MAG TPA: response regulator [Acidimicrobiales bacterium]|nr:response regulator [Acidimicrobiales bacterium]
MRILVAADAHWITDEVSAALSGEGTEVVEVTQGAAVLPWLMENDADLVILDLQIGNMGAIAVCQDLRLEESADRLDRVPVLILLDRRADVFLARRVDADGWLVKPLDPIRLRRAYSALMADGTYYDPSFAPSPIAVGAPPSAPSAGDGPLSSSRIGGGGPEVAAGSTTAGALPPGSD